MKPLLSRADVPDSPDPRETTDLCLTRPGAGWWLWNLQQYLLCMCRVSCMSNPWNGHPQQ